MRVNRTGITRIVLVFDSFVIKVPNFTYGWRAFLRGLLANIDESRQWHDAAFNATGDVRNLLCPVIWAAWGGWLLVMNRADVESHEQEVARLPHMNGTHGWYEWRENYYKA